MRTPSPSVAYAIRLIVVSMMMMMVCNDIFWHACCSILLIIYTSIFCVLWWVSNTNRSNTGTTSIASKLNETITQELDETITQKLNESCSSSDSNHCVGTCEEITLSSKLDKKSCSTDESESQWSVGSEGWGRITYVVSIMSLKNITRISTLEYNRYKP